MKAIHGSSSAAKPTTRCLVHFARIGGQYLISAPSYGNDVTGRDFRALVRGLLERQPTLRPARPGGNITWHPSALLVMLVASALFKTGHAADAAQARPADAASAQADRAPLRVSVAAADHGVDDIVQQAQQNAAILAAMALVAAPLDESAVPTMVVSAAEPPPPVHPHFTPSALPPDPDADSHAGGAGSLAVTPPSHVAALPPPLADAASHAHNVAPGQLPAAPIAEGSATVAAAHLAGPDLPVLPVAGWPVAAAAHAVEPASGLAATLLSLLGGNEPILYSSTLPAEFVSSLHSGVHIASADLVTVSHMDPVSQTSAPATPSPAVSASASSHATATPAPAETAMPASPAASVSGNAAAASTPAAQPVATPSAPDLATVLAIMQNFAAQVGPHLAVLVSGSQVIEYDYFAVDHTPASVSAVTYDFTDGSHISLIGLPSELPHARA